MFNMSPGKIRTNSQNSIIIIIIIKAFTRSGTEHRTDNYEIRPLIGCP